MELVLPNPPVSVRNAFEFSASGMQWAPVSGTVSNRFLVSYRMQEQALARLVPSPFTLDTREGQGFLSVCAVEILDMGIRGLPRPLRFELECTSHDGDGDAGLDAETEPLLEAQGSVFPDAQAAAEFLLGTLASSGIHQVWRAARWL